MFGARVIWGPGEGWIHSLTWCQLEGCCSIFHLPTSMLEGLMNCYILQPRFIDSVLFRWGRSVESVLIPWPYPHFAEFSGTHATLMTNAHALSCWIVTSNMMLLWNSWDSLLDIIIWMQLARGVRCTECSQAKGCLRSVFFEPFDFCQGRKAQSCVWLARTDLSERSQGEPDIFPVLFVLIILRSQWHFAGWAA